MSGCPLPFGPGDNDKTESGFGTVVVHATLTTGGAAAGLETYVVARDVETRRTTDGSGTARFENVPAGSWDVGYFESPTYRTGPSGDTSRRRVDVENDKTTELTFVVLRTGSASRSP